MKMHPVRSTMIEAIGYDAELGSLLIDFHNGSSYEYFMVPRTVYEKFLESPSKGSFFRERLQDGPYAFECVRQRR